MTAVTVAPRAAAADALVLESYVGERPDDADRIVAPVLSELARSGFVAGADGVGAAFEGQYSWSGLGADAKAIEGYETAVSDGFRAWTDAKFDAAVEQLGAAVDVAQASPLAIATKPKLRAAYRMALVGLALAHKRRGDTAESEQVMAELIRSFPDLALTRADYGPEAFTLYQAVKKSLAGQGTGDLTITVDDPGVDVYVDEQFVEAKEAALTGLVPGTYRILFRKGSGKSVVGRAYHVEVTAGATARLEVFWAFDQALHTGPGWAGFSFPDAETRDADLPAHVSRFARLMHADKVVVLTIGPGVGTRRRSITGVVYSEPQRTASVTLEPVEPTADHLRALGSYLAGTTDTPPPVEPTRPAAARTASGWAPRWVPYVTLGLAAVAAGSGAYLWAIDGDPTCDVAGVVCPYVYDTRMGGIALVGTSVVAVAAAVVVYLHDRGRHEESEPPPVSVAAHPGGATVAWSWTF